MSVKYLSRMAVAAVLGCSSTPVDVGSYAGADEEVWGWTDEKTCASGPQLGIVGTWTGFTEVPSASSQSAAVRLVISHANGKRACGSLTFGLEAPPWPPVTDAESAYPPELANTHLPSFLNFLTRLEGVPLTLTGAKVELPHMKFRASYGQWREWCAMQTSYPCEDVTSSEYFCVPASGSGAFSPRIEYVQGVGCVTFYGGESRVVDCGKALLCIGGPCVCTSGQCTAPAVFGTDYELEFHGETAEGSGMHLTKLR